MNRFVINIMLILLLLIGGMSVAYAEEANRPPRPEGRMKPPSEAIAACKGKSEGVQVQFTTPRGDTLKGVCKEVDGILAAMPERGARPPQGKPPDEGKGRTPAD
jgi:hypothetical protein